MRYRNSTSDTVLVNGDAYAPGAVTADVNGYFAVGDFGVPDARASTGDGVLLNPAADTVASVVVYLALTAEGCEARTYHRVRTAATP